MLEGGGGHRPAPDKRLAGRGNMTHGKPLHAILFHGDEKAGVLILSLHLDDGVFGAGHGGDGGAVDVGIGNAYAVAQAGERHGQVHGDGAFPHAAFAGRYADDIPHLPQLLQIELDALRGRFGGVFDDGVHLDLRTAGKVPVQAGLHGAGEVGFERVRPLGEGQGHVDLILFDGNVFHHAEGYHALVAFGGMLHLLQPLKYLVLCHLRVCLRGKKAKAKDRTSSTSRPMEAMRETVAPVR